MQAVRTQAYLAKARDLLAGMKLCGDLAQSECRTSSAMLAVHSAISYGDALWVALGNGETKAGDHKVRAPKLRKALSERSYDKQQGIRHLESLLSEKTKVAYSDAIVTERQAQSMMDHAQRFSTWVNTAAGELDLKGWRDGEFN